MSRREPLLLVQDMIEAIEAIEVYSREMDYNAFSADQKTVDAVLRNLTILGESASRIPSNFKDEHADIEWEKIIKSRHVIVHDYFKVDKEIVWRILTDYLPDLRVKLEKLL